jgi:hypothetical protein
MYWILILSLIEERTYIISSEKSQKYKPAWGVHCKIYLHQSDP